MKPTKLQILGFYFTSDVRFASDQRTQLIRHIIKYLSKENSRVLYNFWGALAAVLAAMIGMIAWIALDENINLDLFVAVLGAIAVASVVVVFYLGIKMFEAYFEVFPHDFPRK